MYTVYKITNNINNKCYIGSSINVKQRWKTHRTVMNQKNSKQYNYPLYCAFRKYGIENFSFSILKDDFDSPEEMQLYEKDMIIYYDSVNKGYNQTYNTDRPEIIIKNNQKCALVDTHENILEKYDSYHEAARKNGEPEDKDWASNIRKVCKGVTSSFQNKIFRDLDNNGNVISKDIKRFHGRKRVVGISVSNPEEEIYFNSISEAAQRMNIPRNSISDCVNGSIRYTVVHGYIWREIDIYGDIILNNIDIDEQINRFNKANPVLDGERHTITEWCDIYNIKPATVRARLRKGIDIETALKMPVKGR